MQSYLTDPLLLLKKLDLKPQAMSFSATAASQFSFKVPTAFVDKMKIADENDPLLKQILPVYQELEHKFGYQTDPLDESLSLTQPGLLQKYHGRALLLVTPGCAINCRYCFRRHYPYDDKGHLWGQIDNNIQLIKHDISIREVILSGGDPLSLSDNKIADLFARLEGISHLKRVRIHSRFPIVDPQRVTNELLTILSRSKLKVIMILHINHANEIAADNQLAIARLIDHKILLFNQSVLLKGVNDDIEVLVQLSETLIENQIIPYYLHMLDKVQGSAHFEVSDKEAIVLYQQLRDKLPGYMLPSLVREISGEKSKLPIGL
ncbi:MAG: EF-P beta-lysylation protein EpmB [gamma proteobacterium symbiont of Taylorina sp.]|nr:EF-P beta-lysylation protein EpmB [gamma proteobacterium symbiont of Taylorina sp.]